MLCDYTPRSIVFLIRARFFPRTDTRPGRLGINSCARLPVWPFGELTWACAPGMYPPIGRRLLRAAWQHGAEVGAARRLGQEFEGSRVYVRRRFGERCAEEKPRDAAAAAALSLAGGASWAAVSSSEAGCDALTQRKRSANPALHSRCLYISLLS